MNTKRAAQLAAVALFTSGGIGSIIVDRLVLTSKEGKDMGGWCFISARNQIEEAIKRAIAEDKPKRKRVKK